MKHTAIKILMVDDKMITTDLDRAGYRKMGVEVRSATSFEQLEKILDKETGDLVVVNMDYTKVSACQICRHVKARKEPMPVVMTSVMNLANMRKEALAAGADLYVVQPVPRQLFIEKLKNLLSQQTRTTERVEMAGEVCFDFAGEQHGCSIGDLSITGMLLNSLVEIPAGTQLQLRFCLPGYKKPLEVAGTVVRILRSASPDIQTHVGLGVKFETFEGDGQKRLERYIQKTSSENSKMIYYL